MSLFFISIFLLGISSLTNAANFTLVYEWPDGLDYEWPSEALKNKHFNPGDIFVKYMAVYGPRIFLSLYKYWSIPASLVSLPTSSASLDPPKLTPFPSWEMNRDGDCNQIRIAKGLEVDSVGRLWVLEDGSQICTAKIWTIDLNNNDQTKLIHRYSFNNFTNDFTHDFVIDETHDGTFVYISRQMKRYIIVFSLEKNHSWTVDLQGINVSSIALSPKDQEPRQLYLSKWNSNELYSISVAALRNGTRTSNPKPIGKWTGVPYRMLMDNQGTMYAAFWGSYISSWNTSQPFHEQRLLEIAGLNTWPFTFAIDQNGTFWMTVFDIHGKPRFRLFKAEVGTKSYIYEAFPVTPAIPMTTAISPKAKPTSVTSTERSSSSSIPTTTESSSPAEETPSTSIQIQSTTKIFQESDAPSTQLPELNHTTPGTSSIPINLTKSSTPTEETVTTEVQDRSIQTGKLQQYLNFSTILFCCNVFTVILLILIFLRQKRKYFLSLNANESHQMTVFRDNHDDVISRSPPPDLQAADISQPAIDNENDIDASVKPQ